MTGGVQRQSNGASTGPQPAVRGTLCVLNKMSCVFAEQPHTIRTRLACAPKNRSPGGPAPSSLGIIVGGIARHKQGSRSPSPRAVGFSVSIYAPRVVRDLSPDCSEREL